MPHVVVSKFCDSLPLYPVKVLCQIGQRSVAHDRSQGHFSLECRHVIPPRSFGYYRSGSTAILLADIQNLH